MDMIDKIQTELKQQGLSMVELARRMKGNTATRKKDLSEILNRKRDPGKDLLEEIAEGLNVKWSLDVSIKSVIIFDGEKEYHTDQIDNNMQLSFLRNVIINLAGFASLVNKINNENGTLYILTDKTHASGSGDLKNVSNELYEEYLRVKP